MPGNGWWSINGAAAIAVWLDFLRNCSSHYSDRCINNLCLASAECCAEFLDPCDKSREQTIQPQSLTRLPVCSARGWSEVEILFFNEHTVQIKAGERSFNRDFAALGMANQRTGQPTLAWSTLIDLANTLA